MSEDMEKYSQQLRQLVEEYYQQQLSFEEYRAQRKLIFDQIESEYAASNQAGENQQSATMNESSDA